LCRGFRRHKLRGVKIAFHFHANQQVVCVEFPKAVALSYNLNLIEYTLSGDVICRSLSLFKRLLIDYNWIVISAVVRRSRADIGRNLGLIFKAVVV